MSFDNGQLIYAAGSVHSIGFLRFNIIANEIIKSELHVQRPIGVSKAKLIVLYDLLENEIYV